MFRKRMLEDERAGLFPFDIPIPILAGPVRDGYLVVSFDMGPDAMLLAGPFGEAMDRAGRCTVLGKWWDQVDDEETLDEETLVAAIEWQTGRRAADLTPEDLLDFHNAAIHCSPPPGHRFRADVSATLGDALVDAPAGLSYELRDGDSEHLRIGLPSHREDLEPLCRALVEILPGLIEPDPDRD